LPAEVAVRIIHAMTVEYLSWLYSHGLMIVGVLLAIVALGHMRVNAELLKGAPHGCC
jgi:hypothetical protein